MKNIIPVKVQQLSVPDTPDLAEESKIIKVTPIPINQNLPETSPSQEGIPVIPTSAISPETIINRFLSGELTEDQFKKLLAEILIRFNTDPKAYQKADYLKLIQALFTIKTLSKSELDKIVEELINLISTKVDKEAGKFLMEYAEREKLKGIESGAEVNVQSDWKQTNSHDDSFIKNKPTKVSQFENDSHYLVPDDIKGKQDVIPDLKQIREGAAKGATALQEESDPIFKASPSAGITQADIDKWNTVQPAVQADWNETDPQSDAFIKNKPTKVSEFENDAEYLTASDINLITKDEIDILFIEIVPYSLRLYFSESGQVESEYSVSFDTKELKLLISDPGGKMTLDESDSEFTDGFNYPIRLKSGGKTDSKQQIQVVTPENGYLGIAIRSASSSATDRTISLSGAATLDPTVVADSQKVGDQYPMIIVPCTGGTVNVTLSAAMNIYGVTFTNEDL